MLHCIEDLKQNYCGFRGGNITGIRGFSHIMSATEGEGLENADIG